MDSALDSKDFASFSPHSPHFGMVYLSLGIHSLFIHSLVIHSFTLLKYSFQITAGLGFRYKYCRSTGFSMCMNKEQLPVYVQVST